MIRWRRTAAAALLTCLAAVDGFAQKVDEFKPARLIEGPVPAPPAQTVGYAEVWLEVSVDAGGSVEKIDTLRTSEPVTSQLILAVGEWRFEPARETDKPVASHVLVAALYRPPALFNNPVIGTPPADVNRPSPEVPYPTLTPPPNYPPNTVLPPGDVGAVVLVEVTVNDRGDPTSAKVVSSTSAGFNDSALQTAESWRFTAARRDGLPVESRAYLIFGFKQPVTGGATPR
jgi:periplasmic protein TonB